MSIQQQENNQTAIFSGLSQLIRDHVLTPLSQHLATRGCNITVDEMANVTMLASRQMQAPQAPPSPMMPPMMNSGIAGLNSVGSFGAPKAVASGKPCPHTLTRASQTKAKGELCGKACAAGSDFCSTHKRNAKTVTNTGATSSFAQPGIGLPSALGTGFPGFSTAPGISGMPTAQIGQGMPMIFGQPGAQNSQFMLPTTAQPTQFGVPSATQPVPIPQPAQLGIPSITLPSVQSVEMTPLQSMPGFSLAKGANRLVCRPVSGKNNEWVCVGYLNANNQLDVNMNQDQLAEAKSKGFTIVDTQNTGPAFGMTNSTGVMLGSTLPTTTLPTTTSPTTTTLPTTTSPTTTTLSTTTSPTTTLPTTTLPTTTSPTTQPIPTVTMPSLPMLSPDTQPQATTNMPILFPGMPFVPQQTN